tara:strand:- start:2469 stop:2840 length:372 start_codon:yes stop_codon:yes gene_type:complete
MLEIVAPEGGTPSHIRDLLVEAGYQAVSEAKEAFNGPGFICARNKRRVALLHDCFWHGHDCSDGRRLPVSSTDFWAQLADHRKRRSDTVERELDRQGWETMIVWRCQSDDPAGLAGRLYSFLM